MTYIPDALRLLVADRAGSRCEYCRLPQSAAYFTHEIDHIYAEKHGGATHEINLCLACYACNRNKGSDICSLDEESGDVISLFHPRKDNWQDHFRLENGNIVPLTPKGRVTARLLRFNSPDRVEDRIRLIRLGQY